jgi:hypothetical protein
MRPEPAEPSEYLEFSIEKWPSRYGFMINPLPGEHLPDLCWQTQEIELRGPLKSKRWRRAKKIRLTLSPTASDPREWKAAWKGFGRIDGIHDCALIGAARLPPDSFCIILSGLAAGKLPMASLGIALRERGTGVITSFSLDDPMWREEEREREVSC